MGVNLGPMPTVPPWMLAPHGPVIGSAEQLKAVAEQVDAAGRTLQTALGDAGGVLGWRSSGAESARVPLVQARSEVGMLRDVAVRAAMSLHSLGATMSEHGAELTKLKARREELEWEAGLVYDESSQDYEPLIEDARRIDRQMAHHIDMLARADRVTRDDLNRVADELTTLGSTDREDEWVGDMAPPEVMALLGRYGGTESAAERALLDQVMLLPDGPAGDEELRRLLAGMTPEELADFLLRHPDAARRLTAPQPLGTPGAYPPGSPEALLATAIAAGKSLPPKERVAAVRSAFAAMSPDDQKRMALLYPGLVGNLDGAPLDLRVAANRVQIGVALDDERARQVDTSRAMAARTPRDEWWGDKNNESWFTYIVDVDDPDSAEARNARRVAYYQQLLYEEVRQPGPQRSTLGDPGDAGPYDQHQILYFDPTGDGQIAEMWGTIGPDTRNVAVFVPGTTADLENFAGDSNKMRALAEKDPTGQTVTITWLGTNLPDAVAANATQAKYAEEGGPKLRDFVWGLDIPPEKRVTAIGHSYGGAVVGVADREGLEVDAVVHIASAGTGRGVDSADDYPDGADGKERYSMTAPGDPIGYIQGRDEAQGLGIGHGSDPDTTYGFTRLETGRYEDGYEKDPKKRGHMIEGGNAHTDVTRPGTTAFDNVYGVVTGGEVTPYVYRQPYEDFPYRDPGFDGPKKDIPDDAGR